MFTQMRMTNFKSWQDTGDVRLAPLTGFFGTNSSGKSSLLQMLLLLKQTTESRDRNLVLKTGNLQEGYVNLGTPNEITTNDTTDMMLSVSWQPMDLQIQGNALHTLTMTTNIHAEPNKVHVQSIHYANEQLDVAMKRGGNNQYTLHVDWNGEEPKRPQGRQHVQMSPQKCYGFSDEALRYYQDTDYLNDIVLNFEQQFQRLHYLGPIRDYPQRNYVWGGERPSNVGLKGEQAVHALLAGKNERVYTTGKRTRLEARIAEWLVELGLAHTFETRPIVKGSNQYEVRLQRHANSHSVLISDLGIGVSQILPVLVLYYYVPEGATIIFEQPELHLHPAVQSGLADVFIDVVKNRNVQVIVESHSEHFLRRLQRRIAEQQLNADDTALYFCDVEQGLSTIQPLDVDVFGNIRNWPHDFFGDVAGDMVAALDASLERQASSNGNA